MSWKIQLHPCPALIHLTFGKLESWGKALEIIQTLFFILVHCFCNWQFSLIIACTWNMEKKSKAHIGETEVKGNVFKEEFVKSLNQLISLSKLTTWNSSHIYEVLAVLCELLNNWIHCQGRRVQLYYSANVMDRSVQQSKAATWVKYLHKSFSKTTSNAMSWRDQCNRLLRSQKYVWQSCHLHSLALH